MRHNSAIKIQEDLAKRPETTSPGDLSAGDYFLLNGSQLCLTSDEDTYVSLEDGVLCPLHELEEGNLLLVDVIIRWSKTV